MAHKLKYYKEIHSYGHDWRVEILQDTELELTPVEIGPVMQGLKLVVQGDQADVDTAIVKTSLELQFVDANDLDDSRKCGYWEEFYTSSSTEYMVKLYKDNVLEWCGYVTPDSFAEDLQYHGSVSIIARDNLGNLQDYTFDASGNADGLISLAEIVAHAKSKVSFAMDIYTDDSLQHIWPKSADDVNGANLYTSALFNVSAFDDKNWWNVLEDTLYSCGVTMRYVGGNRYVVTPIRNMGLADYNIWADVPILDASFVAYGNRSLSPAAKAIKEEVSFDIQENIGHYIINEDDYGNESIYDFMPQPQISNDYISMPIHAVVGGGWEVRDAEHTLFLNANAYEEMPAYRYGKGGSVHDTNNVYLACNVEYGTWKQRTAAFSQRVKAGKYSIKFDVFGIIALYNNNKSIGYIDSNAYLDTFNMLIKFYGNDGSVWSFKHITGGYQYEWVNQDINDGIPSSGAIPFTYSSPEFDVPVEGKLTVTISQIETWDNTSKSSKGMYLGVNNVQLMVVDNDEKPIMDKLRITTKYNDKNNITLVRSPKFAANPSEIVSSRFIQNGIYVVASDGWPIGSEKWSWHNDITQPLTILTHQEMLAYYARPMDMLTGELATSDPSFNCIYAWNGKKYVLTSGSLNILTGRMESAVLREFIRYDHMWETWVENDDVEVDFALTYISLWVHSNKMLDVNSWGDDIPENWIAVTSERYDAEKQAYEFRLAVMENLTGQKRVAIFHIDTAVVRITQKAAGDYGIDYGEDYS